MKKKKNYRILGYCEICTCSYRWRLSYSNTVRLLGMRRQGSNVIIVTVSRVREHQLMDQPIISRIIVLLNQYKNLFFSIHHNYKQRYLSAICG
jgi:hypothetical protein